MSQYAHPDVLVNTQWLAEHLNAPNFRVVESDLNSEAYIADRVHSQLGEWLLTKALRDCSWVK